MSGWHRYLVDWKGALRRRVPADWWARARAVRRTLRTAVAWSIGRPMSILVGLLPDAARFVVASRIGRRRPLDYGELDLVLEIASEPERGRLHPCAKEPETVAWLERHGSRNMVLYDIGANVGAYALIAARLGGSGARVIAVEPGATTFPRLVRNILANDLVNRIVALPMAVGAQTGLVRFVYASLEPGAADHPGIIQVSGRAAAAALETPCYRLDDLVRDLGLPLPTIMKIDVDGGEAAVLEGGTRVLGEPSLRSVLVEVREGSCEADAVVSTLEAQGFTLEEGRLHDGGIVRNLIFSRPD